MTRRLGDRPNRAQAAFGTFNVVVRRGPEHGRRFWTGLTAASVLVA